MASLLDLPHEIVLKIIRLLNINEIAILNKLRPDLFTIISDYPEITYFRRGDNKTPQFESLWDILDGTVKIKAGSVCLLEIYHKDILYHEYERFVSMFKNIDYFICFNYLQTNKISSPTNAIDTGLSMSNIMETFSVRNRIKPLFTIFDMSFNYLYRDAPFIAAVFPHYKAFQLENFPPYLELNDDGKRLYHFERMIRLQIGNDIDYSQEEVAYPDYIDKFGAYVSANAKIPSILPHLLDTSILKELIIFNQLIKLCNLSFPGLEKLCLRAYKQSIEPDDEGLFLIENINMPELIYFEIGYDTEIPPGYKTHNFRHPKLKSVRFRDMTTYDYNRVRATELEKIFVEDLLKDGSLIEQLDLVSRVYSIHQLNYEGLEKIKHLQITRDINATHDTGIGDIRFSDMIFNLKNLETFAITIVEQTVIPFEYMIGNNVKTLYINFQMESLPSAEIFKDIGPSFPNLKEIYFNGDYHKFPAPSELQYESLRIVLPSVEKVNFGMEKFYLSNTRISSFLKNFHFPKAKNLEIFTVINHLGANDFMIDISAPLLESIKLKVKDDLFGIYGFETNYRRLNLILMRSNNTTLEGLTVLEDEKKPAYIEQLQFVQFDEEEALELINSLESDLKILDSDSEINIITPQQLKEGIKELPQERDLTEHDIVQEFPDLFVPGLIESLNG